MASGTIKKNNKVESVNGKTGAVSLDADDVSAIPAILDASFYGDTLPVTGTEGQIFFLKA